MLSLSGQRTEAERIDGPVMGRAGRRQGGGEALTVTEVDLRAKKGNAREYVHALASPCSCGGGF